MTSRRSFLKNAFFSGITFCSCGLLDEALAQYPASEEKKELIARTKDAGNDPELSYRHPWMGKKHAPVIIDGKRIFTIDTHAHCFFPEAVALAGEGAVINAAVKGGPQHYIPLSDRAAIQANVMGVDFSNPKFDPVWAKAQELGATLFMHPQSTPQLASRFKGNGWLANTIGNPLDTTIALQHLIFDGTLDKFPNLKIIAPHGGGYLASYAPRSDHSCFISPSNCDPNIKLKKKPTEYLNQLYFDSLVFTPEALRHLIAQVGASQIVIGTDQPIPWNEDPIGHVMETPISNKDKAKILGLTAAKLLNVKTT